MSVDHHDSSGRSWVLPLFVAAGSVGIGVALGAFVAVQMLATPVKVDTRSQQAALASKLVAASAETTGYAACDDGKGCDGQTWPYLSRNCVQQAEAKEAAPATASPANPDPAIIEPEPKNLRVVAPDNVAPAAVAAIEAKPAAPSEGTAAKGVVSETAAQPATQPTTQATVNSAPTQADVRNTAATPAVAALPETAPLPLAKPHVVAKPVRTAKKSKPKPRIKDEAKPEQDDSRVASSVDDDDGQSVASNVHYRRIGRRGDRDYDAAAYAGRDERRIVVIRREEPVRGPFGGGGLFGGLFGAF